MKKCVACRRDWIMSWSREVEPGTHIVYKVRVWCLIPGKDKNQERKKGGKSPDALEINEKTKEHEQGERGGGSLKSNLQASTSDSLLVCSMHVLLFVRVRIISECLLMCTQKSLRGVWIGPRCCCDFFDHSPSFVFHLRSRLFLHTHRAHSFISIFRFTSLTFPPSSRATTILHIQQNINKISFTKSPQHPRITPTS